MLGLLNEVFTSELRHAQNSNKRVEIRNNPLFFCRIQFYLSDGNINRKKYSHLFTNVVMRDNFIHRSIIKKHRHHYLASSSISEFVARSKQRVFFAINARFGEM